MSKEVPYQCGSGLLLSLKRLNGLSLAVDKGLSHAMQVVLRKEAEYPTGYSAAGVVVAVGKEINDLKVGDRLACAGGQYAYHAEFIRVPRNLCVPIPAGVGFDEASTITLGAIALQGVRRAMPTLGETFVARYSWSINSTNSPSER